MPNHSLNNSDSSHAAGKARELPAHIAAQLASAGRATDTAGQEWEGRNLGEGTSHTHQFPADTGETDSGVQSAFEKFEAGEAFEEEVVLVFVTTCIVVSVFFIIDRFHFVQF